MPDSESSDPKTSDPKTSDPKTSDPKTSDPKTRGAKKMPMPGTAERWVRNDPVRAVVAAAVVALVIGAIGGLAAGYKIEKSRTKSAASSNKPAPKSSATGPSGKPVKPAVASARRVGLVTAVSSGTISLTTKHAGQQTIKIGAATQIEQAAKGTKADVVVGRHVFIKVTPREVLVLASGATFGRTVDRVEPGFFTMAKGNGLPAGKITTPDTLPVDIATKATAADIKVGATVLVDGHGPKGGPFVATDVILLPPGSGFAA